MLKNVHDSWLQLLQEKILKDLKAEAEPYVKPVCIFLRNLIFCKTGFSVFSRL